MSKVTKFEDLIAWQKARLLTREIYRITEKTGFRKDWGLTNQMRRAAVSIMSNIAEGFERNRPKEFQHFLSIAKASSGEVRSLLYVARDVKYIDADEFCQLFDLSLEVGRITNGLRGSISRWQ
ncbi:MAG: four helix bundle protein [Ardenticatenaceae bacterium]|nr:four helix bundle protein [Ardenticatenaceae bacterium]